MRKGVLNMVASGSLIYGQVSVAGGEDEGMARAATASVNGVAELAVEVQLYHGRIDGLVAEMAWAGRAAVATT